MKYKLSYITYDKKCTWLERESIQNCVCWSAMVRSRTKTSKTVWNGSKWTEIRFLFNERQTLEAFALANETYFKFMFVRHPMERLLSCYLDKMVESTHETLPPYRRHVMATAQRIMKQRAENERTRRVAGRGRRTLKSLSTMPNKSHPNTVGVLSGNFRKTVAADLNPASNSSTVRATKPYERKPTFEEFLEFILNTTLQGIPQERV